ncbi:hypothetical protein AB833_00850 [Chromatiales bacterium (ex Bugula neritina AB1)]|nr:hypothetical protein AB833_00850 [Chromatiales bacterium (ex Bugula neritina AB1)]
MAETDRKAFKDWFDRNAAAQLAAQFKRVDQAFDEKRFVQLACRKLQQLEFNARIGQFSNAMAQTLPAHYPAALAVIVESLPAAQTNCDDSISDGWLQWPVGQFIADHGVDYLNESMAAMIELTQRFSAEFAVRPFVEHHQDAVFEQLLKLTRHKNPHVRRWCSEGTRTRLPWGRKLFGLIENPAPVWKILEKLKDDEELYVRRSVANSINDLAKDHPQQVIRTCKSWSKTATKERDWIIRHGLRTLIKDGRPGALAVIGFGPIRQLKTALTVSPVKVEIGESVQLSLDLVNESGKPQHLLIDYIVHYVRKNGVVNAKVFKWKTVLIEAKNSLVLEKRHPMKVTAVRALYAGVHRVDIQINGECMASREFELQPSTER